MFVVDPPGHPGHLLERTGRLPWVFALTLAACILAMSAGPTGQAIASPAASMPASRRSHLTARMSFSAVRRPASRRASAASAGGAKRECVMNQDSVSGLTAFASMVGRKTIDCAMVFNAPPDWASWSDPWFIRYEPPSDLAWAGWVRNSPATDHRQLIISQPLIPESAAHTNWRKLGASGAYVGYARQFAENLVTAGVGDAIIRLSWEMNGTWFDDDIGSTQTQMTEWVTFWRKTVDAMRSVPGAQFKFVWCVNNGYRDIPFTDYYPGNNVVDIIGDDVYDQGVPIGQNRWNFVYHRPGGLASVISFARANAKPIAIPEWGVGTADSAEPVAGPGGDDPAFIDGIADVVEENDVAFQSYFYAHEWDTQLRPGTRSLAAYRAAFGDDGPALGPDNGTDETSLFRAQRKQLKP